MNKLALTLLSSPTILGSALSVLVTVNPAHAIEPVALGSQNCWNQSTSQVSRLSCARLSQTAQNISDRPKAQAVSSDIDEPPMLEFTEEESDAALQLFGCDCIVCINAIRQMRGLAPIGT